MSQEEIARFLALLVRGLNYQNVFRTRTGYVGMTSSWRVKRGDFVVLVRGCRSPLVVRRVKGDDFGTWTWRVQRLCIGL
jgi:hypothetical protein